MNDEYKLKLENQLCFPIYASSRIITKLYKPFLNELNLTYPQYLVMLVLWEIKHITLKDLGNKLYLDSGTLTPLLKRLESMNLIERERSTEDERLLFVTLTEKGENLKSKAINVPDCILKCTNMEISDLIELKKSIDLFLNKISENL